MSSTMVSNIMEFRETFAHKDLPNRNVAAELLNMTTFEKSELPGFGAFSSAVIGPPPPVHRRHSSSMFGSAVAAKPVPTTRCTFADSNGFLNKAALSGALETVVEERFRSRAFSEGSSLLSNEALLKQQQPPSRYKTELCRPFEESGKCKYGDKCQFAHGKHELRHMVRHPKYKTELCRTYHTSGLCPYGPRCNFIHNQEEPTVGMQRAAMNGMPIPTTMSPLSSQAQMQQVTGSRSGQMSRPQRGINRLSNILSANVSLSLENQQTSFFGNDTSIILSPHSPITATGQIFNYGNPPLSPMEMPRGSGFGSAGCVPERLQASPPLSHFDVFAQAQQLDHSSSDDGVFMESPPDSDRESVTGSPPFGVSTASHSPPQQRLPIFRCLSQSE